VDAGRKGATTLINRDDVDVSVNYPEVQLHEAVSGKHIVLDGELVVMTNGVPDFYATRSRALMRNDFKIDLASKLTPVSFVAFDILYKDGKNLCNLELTKRKEILSKTVIENEFFSVSRVIEVEGLKLFEMAVKNNLEGVIAKKVDSIYQPNKRTTDWLKFVNPKFPSFKLAIMPLSRLIRALWPSILAAMPLIFLDNSICCSL